MKRALVPVCCLDCRFYDDAVNEYGPTGDPFCHAGVAFPTKKQACARHAERTYATDLYREVMRRARWAMFLEEVGE